MGLMDELKQEIKNTGTSKGKFLYFKDGSKVRVRFLHEIDDGLKVPFHDSYALGINVPCQELFGRDCKYCGDDELRTRNQYAWCVYDYESEEVKILMYPVNNCSPIPQLISFSETYGTITDRDYEIKQNGKGQNKTFSIVPLEVRKFRNTKAKPLSKSALLKYIDKAYPAPEDDEEEESKQNKKKGNKTQNQSAKNKKYMNEPEDDEEEEGDEEEEETRDYEEMTARELFKLCKERGIECRPKKDKEYYIELLEEADEEDEDDWDEEEEDEEEDW